MVTPLCILLVDESKFFLELEKQFLRNTPSTVLFATSGEQALELAREFRPSLVYMDINMSMMTGLECCQSIKSDPELHDIPVILIGEQSSESDKAEAKAVSADGYISKPLDRRVFLGVGHSFLLSIDRREPRRNCNISVSYLCRGRQLQGRCLDISSGGMFLDCQPTAEKGESLILKFALPDEYQTRVELKGKIAWANTTDVVIKPDYPLGYGVEFDDIPDNVGAILRRCFG
jgi:CheY-like chemotaxis protein